PEQILAHQMTDDLPALAAERADVSRELEEVLRRAVRGDPARRFQSAAAFRQALEGATGAFWRRLWAVLKPES
ncbi:MAG: hypothetical protein ACREMC_00595, partial [Gemmatimonadales bacterium]